MYCHAVPWELNSVVLTACWHCVLQQIGGMLNVVGAVVLLIVVPAVATQHQPASYVFGHFERAQAESVGITNPV